MKNTTLTNLKAALSTELKTVFTDTLYCENLATNVCNKLKEQSAIESKTNTIEQSFGAQSDLDAAKLRIKRLIKENHELDKALMDSVETIMHKNLELNISKRDTADKAASIEELEDEIEELIEENEELKYKMEASDKDLEETTNVAKYKDFQIVVLNKAHKESTGRIKMLEQTIEGLRRSLAQDEELLQEYSDLECNLKEKTSELRKKCGILVADNEELRLLTHDQGALEKRYSELEYRLEGRVFENRNLHAKYAELLKQNEDLRARVKEQQDYIETNWGASPKDIKVKADLYDEACRVGRCEGKLVALAPSVRR